MALILATQSLSDEERALIAHVRSGTEVRAAPDADAVPAHLGEAEILFGGHFSRDWLADAPHLRWVQVGSAGVDRMPLQALHERQIRLTNASGVYDDPIAEHLLALMLAHARRLPQFRDQQGKRIWNRISPDLLQGKTLGVLGLGSIGTALARRAQALGMRVLGLRRTQGERPPCVERLLGPDGLPELLSQSDYLALTLPLTPATRHILNEPALRRMKPSAFVLNIGRGALIDEPALASAVREGRLAGAGLDVFESEPLPTDSPLWDLPGVIITPHVAGGSPSNRGRLVSLFCRNLAAYLDGGPMPTEVDYDAGY